MGKCWDSYSSTMFRIWDRLHDSLWGCDHLRSSRKSRYRIPQLQWRKKSPHGTPRSNAILVARISSKPWIYLLNLVTKPRRCYYHRLLFDGSNHHPGLVNPLWSLIAQIKNMISWKFQSFPVLGSISMKSRCFVYPLVLTNSSRYWSHGYWKFVSCPIKKNTFSIVMLNVYKRVKNVKFH